MVIRNHPYQVNDRGHLMVGDIDTVDLANKYGTPLYVYDVSIIRENCRSFVNTFKELGVKAQVAYASKAFSTIAMLQVIKQENLSLDVVSEGELYTALMAGFPTNKIHLHGNNKSYNELHMAVTNDIGCIVIDNFYEIDLLEQILEKENKKIDVLIRVTPGIESETHHYIMTGNEDSKFGFNMVNGQVEEAFNRLHNHENLQFKGLHCHIGSQIFATDSFLKAVEVLYKQLSEWNKKYQYTPQVINLGGGFGIRYVGTDQPLPFDKHVKEIVHSVKENSKQFNLPLPEIWIEPGRSIVGNAGITLYTIGSTKDIPGVRKYVAVDGGMTDNLRPALYEAKYEGVIANKANDPVTETVSIAGKACESGDMLIWDISLPKVQSGDIFAVFSTGAYGYSMANNYNRFARPAVVFVEKGKDVLVVKRETNDDIVKNDLSYE